MLVVVARKPRNSYAGGIYHVTTRSNDRRLVFVDDNARLTFLRQFVRIAARYEWRTLAYCLMTTHYHVVLRTPEGGLSEGMRDLNGGFARWWNRRQGRRDHVFGKRFGSVEVRTDSHLLEACRYVVLNPVRAGLCSDPAEWLWSSHRASAGIDHAPNFLAVGELLSAFSHRPALARRAYRRFVAGGQVRAAHVPVPGIVTEA
jgi:putative transposase